MNAIFMSRISTMERFCKQFHDAILGTSYINVRLSLNMGGITYE